VKTILIADDDPRIRKRLTDLFARERDYQLCEQGKNGKEAVEIATRCNPDLVISDFSMPVMSGLQAAKKIKLMLPGVPIILFTMHDEVLFAKVGAVDAFIDRIMNKVEFGRLIYHVRELAPV
jgi:YesN/AraC family two-component response regulator